MSDTDRNNEKKIMKKIKIFLNNGTHFEIKKKNVGDLHN